MKTYFVAFRLVTAFSLAVFLSSTGTSATEPMPDPFAGMADEYRTLTRPLMAQKVQPIAVAVAVVQLAMA